MTGPGRRGTRSKSTSTESEKLARSIRSELRKHLRVLGLLRRRDGTLSLSDKSKDGYRVAHGSRRAERLLAERDFIQRTWSCARVHFADGSDIDPERIDPVLERVRAGTWQSDLFRLASLTWSVPVSRGYGRRLRFLVWDRSNKKLIGLIALGDPVFNLRARERSVGWSGRYRASRLVNVMDAYVLGAVPPYNQLLGGKLVASLVRSKEVKGAFQRYYSNRRGLISGRRKRASLVLVTTTSALGKSAMLDRLRIGNVSYFKSVGFTNGWGHFHLPESLFTMMRQYLRAQGHPYANGHHFGDGPNWKLRAARQALNLAGVNDNVLSHGIPREVFLCWLAKNGRDVLARKQQPRPDFGDLLSVREVAELAIRRWVVPRATRRPEYKEWSKDGIADLLSVNGASLTAPATWGSNAQPEILVAG